MIKGKKNVGGLIGHNKGKIKNCYVSKGIKVIGEENVGALAGKNEGEIIDSGISNNFQQLKNSGSTKINSISDDIDVVEIKPNIFSRSFATIKKNFTMTNPWVWLLFAIISFIIFYFFKSGFPN